MARSTYCIGLLIGLLAASACRADYNISITAPASVEAAESFEIFGHVAWEETDTPVDRVVITITKSDLSVIFWPRVQDELEEGFERLLKYKSTTQIMGSGSYSIKVELYDSNNRLLDSIYKPISVTMPPPPPPGGTGG